MGADGKETAGKLRRYNERMFAVMGTVVAATVLFFVVAGAYETASSILRSMRDDPGQLVTDEAAQEAAEQGLRLQAASFQMPERLFEKHPYFVIPVGQHTLEEPEVMANVQQFSDGYARSYWQHTNNLIVWNEKTDQSQLVLPERLRVSRQTGYLENGKPYLLVNTQRITEGKEIKGVRIADWALWVYGLEDGSRTKIELPGKVALEFDRLYDSKLAFVLVGEDRNGDGIYDRSREPALLYRVNAAAGTLNPAVPDAIRQRIQNILDGVEEQAE
jgi:hypothetical protein